MNRDEILNMPAGAKMNQFIWWKVFDMTPLPPNNDISLLPDYSIDIKAARKVVEKVGSIDELHDVEIRTSIRGWFCNIFNAFDSFEAGAETAPLAICRAALLAVWNEK